MRSWEELDARPDPAWFDHDKIGIFLHWGLFSLPGFARPSPEGTPYGHGGHSCWYGTYADRLYPLAPEEQAAHEEFHARAFGGGTSYDDIAHLFRAELYDPSRWADTFRRAGAKWAIVTSNFHDGFCIWPSPYSPHWNSAVLGAKRDLLGEFCGAMRREGLRAGFYYSVLEHNHPLYPKPEAHKPHGDLRAFVDHHMQPQLRLAVERYTPSFIYLDGEWDYPAADLRMQEFVDWLYHDSPCRDDVVINDRFGMETRGLHGGVYCSEIGNEQSGHAHKWIEDRPLARGDWSRNRNQRLDVYLAERDMLHILVATIARGGNIHLALSPYADGTLPMIEEERLGQLGEWLGVNGEGIYGSRRWAAGASEGPLIETNNPRLVLRDKWVLRHERWQWALGATTPLVHYTAKHGAVYAFVLDWPRADLTLMLPRPGAATTVELLGHGCLDWRERDGGIEIAMPRLHPSDMPCRHVWTIKLAGLANG